MKDEFLQAFRGAPVDMLIVKRSPLEVATDRPHYAWRVYYGDRYLGAPTPDRALEIGWSVWGGHVPALVFA